MQEFHLEIILVLGVPVLTAMFFIAKHFWTKAKCLHLMEQRIHQIEIEIKRSKEKDNDIFDRLNSLDSNFSHISGQLTILIEHTKK